MLSKVIAFARASPARRARRPPKREGDGFTEIALGSPHVAKLQWEDAMKSDMQVTRRAALKAGATFATGAVLSGTAGAQNLNRFERQGPLDPNHRTLLKGGTIVSMDPTVGDLVRGDLLIEGKKIAAIAPELNP